MKHRVVVYTAHKRERSDMLRNDIFQDSIKFNMLSNFHAVGPSETKTDKISERLRSPLEELELML